MPKILFSTSINAVDKDLVGDLSLGWRSRQGELSDLIDCVKRGHPINAAIFNSAKRLDSNFVEANLVILDIDNGKKVDGQKIYDPKLSIEEAIAHPFVKAHCLYSYTSSSHSPDWHKFRLILLLSEPVANIEVYKRIIRLVAQSVNGCDRAAMSATNIFFGNTNAQDIIVNPDATPIDVGAIYELFAEQDAQSERSRLERQKTRNLQSEDDRTPVEWARYYLSFIDPSRANQYNHWIAVGMTLKSISEELFTDWCNWSSQQGSYKGEVDCWMHWRGASFANKTPEEAIAKLGAWSKQDGRETKPRREKVAVKEKDGARSQKGPTNDEGKPSLESVMNKIFMLESKHGFLTAQYYWHLEDLADELKRSSKWLQGVYNRHLSERNVGASRTFEEICQGNNEEISWLVPDLIYRGGTTLFHADGGTGKTLLMYWLVKSLTEKTSFLGVPVTERVRCGLIQIDEPELVLSRRLRELGLDTSHNVAITDWSFGQVSHLDKWIEDNNLGFLVIDSFFAGQKFAETSENDADHAAVLMRLRDVAIRTNCAIVIIHHSNKQGGARGSGAITGAVSEVWKLSVPEPEIRAHYKMLPDDRIFECKKTRMCDPFKVAIKLEEDSYQWVNRGDLKRIDNGTANQPATSADKIKAFVLNCDRPFTITDLLASQMMVGLNRDTVKQCLNRLATSGFVSKFKESGGKAETLWIASSRASHFDCHGVTVDPQTQSGGGLENRDTIRDTTVTDVACHGLSQLPVTVPNSLPSNDYSPNRDTVTPKNEIFENMRKQKTAESSEPAPHKPSRPYGGPPVGATVQFKDRGLTPAYRRKLIETATDYPWGAVGHVDTIVKNTNRHEIIVSVGDKTYLVDNFLAIETLELPDEYLSPPESEDAWYVNEDYDQGELL